MSDGHSKLFPPSSAHRWMNCTASPDVVQKYKDTAGPEAMEGTAAHFLLEECLTKGTNANDYRGREIKVSQDGVSRGFIVTREMAYDVQTTGIDPVRALVSQGGTSRVEVTARLPHIDPELFGRFDAFHIDGAFDTLTVFDFKYGRLDVSPQRNPQLMLYALGIYREFFADKPVQKIRLMVGQPRSLTPGPRVKDWECDLDELLNFELEARVAVHAVRSQPEFKMGNWCKYCPALGECPASQEQRKWLSHALAAVDMGPAEAAKILALKTMIEKKIKDAERVAADCLMAGQPVEGRKLVTETKFRQWRDEEQAKDALYSVYGAQALKPPTPAQAEKLGVEAQDIVARLSFTPDGGPKVAALDDRRPPFVRRTTEQIFGSTQGV